MNPFALTKWYFDSVEAGGRSAIAYSTALDWGPAHVGWHAVSICEPGGRLTQRTSVAALPAPARAGDRIAWQSDAMRCAVTCVPTAGPFARRLIDGPDGTLDWRCEAPAARVDVALAGTPAVSGVGYAECLTLTLLPWRLPIQEMRWGRWVSDDGARSLVWIDWKGESPRTDAWLNGCQQPDPVVGDGIVTAGRVTLAMEPRRTIYSRSLASSLSGLGPVLALLPEAWKAVEDTKRICRARLDGEGCEAMHGWCIDELVRFPR